MNSEEKFRLHGVSRITNSFYEIDAEKGVINKPNPLDSDKKSRDNNIQEILDRMKRAH